MRNSYAFDVEIRHGSPFLTNRRLLAFVETGVPFRVKCDASGNVYSGCDDGLHVWSPGGVLLGKFLVPDGTFSAVSAACLTPAPISYPMAASFVEAFSPATDS